MPNPDHGPRPLAKAARAARIAAVVIGAGLGLGPGPTRVWAGNTEHPRTPVLWPDAPCIHTVVRSEEPVFAFAYTIPFEDTLLSVDELDDSRTHQFIGFCRQWPAGRPPPRYVSLADLDRAIEAGFEDPVTLAEPEATLETSVAWAGCWTRITGEDQRRPITFAAAAEPVAWDTSELSPGTWTIAGYTWEPPYNLWRRAPWVVRVVDEDPQLDPSPIQAAAALADTDDALYFDDSLEIELCVDAEASSTITLEWANAKDETLAWAPVADASLPAAGAETLSLPFSPPEPSWGATVLLRARVEQPAGPAYTSDALAPVIVYKPSGDGDGDGDGDSGDSGTGDDGADDGGDGDGGDTGTDGGETGAPGDAGEPDAGGRCSVGAGRGKLAGWIGLALALLATRRRRASSEHAAKPAK